VLSGDSVPEPDDPRQPRWDCESTSANTVRSQAARCDGYAVFAKPQVQEQAARPLFLTAALFGVVAAILAETLLRARWPRRRRDQG